MSRFLIAHKWSVESWCVNNVVTRCECHPQRHNYRQNRHLTFTTHHNHLPASLLIVCIISLTTLTNTFRHHLFSLSVVQSEFRHFCPRILKKNQVTIVAGRLQVSDDQTASYLLRCPNCIAPACRSPCRFDLSDIVEARKQCPIINLLQRE